MSLTDAIIILSLSVLLAWAIILTIDRIELENYKSKWRIR